MNPLHLFAPARVRLAAVFSLVLILPTTLPAQDAEIEFFEGGRIDGRFSVRSSLFTGAGIDGALRGFTAPAQTDPFIVFGNPAALGMEHESRLAVCTVPTIELEVTDLYDVQPTVEEEVDAALESFDRSGPLTYPVVSGRVGRGGSTIAGVAAGFTFDREKPERVFGIPHLLDRFAVGYDQPLALQIESVMSGFRMRLRTIEDIDDNETVLYTTLKIGADLDITADRWVIAGARRVGDVWLGLALSRTDLALDFTGYQRNDGQMFRAGFKGTFNNPADPWENRYLSQASVHLKGKSWGTRLGAVYSPTRKLRLGADLRLQSNLDMEGTLDFQVFRFPALNLNAEEDEKQFDINLIEDYSNLTRTYPKDFQVPSTVSCRLPGAFSIAATFLGIFSPSVNFRKYFGELSYSIAMSEDGKQFIYKRGLKPEWGVNLALDLSVFQLRVGATKIADLVEGYHDKSGVPIEPGEPVLVPQLTLGFDTHLEDNLTIGTLLVGLPEDALRFSLVYSFK